MKQSQRLLAKNKEEKINKIYREIYLNSLKSGRFLSVILCHSFSFDVAAIFSIFHMYSCSFEMTLFDIFVVILDQRA